MKTFKVIFIMIVIFAIQSSQALESISPEPTTGQTVEITTPTPTPQPVPQAIPRVITPVYESEIETDDKLNPKLLNTLPAVNILNLSGTDADGKEIKRFAIQTLPDGDAGILYLADGQTEVRVGQFLTIEESDNIRFDPNESFEGNATFTYSSVARNGAVDNSPATVTLPIVSATSTTVEPTVVTPIVGGAEHNNTGCPVHEEEDCSCEAYEASIPVFSKLGILLMMMLTVFMGNFFMKKEI